MRTSMLSLLIFVCAVATAQGFGPDGTDGASGGPTLEIYDARDLVRDAARAAGDASPRTSGDAVPAQGDSGAVASGLIDAIRTFVVPPLGDGDSVSAVDESPGTIVVRAHGAHHRWIHAFFAELRSRAARVSIVTPKLFSLQADAVKAHALDAPRVLVGAAEAGALLEQLAAESVPKSGLPRGLISCPVRALLETSSGTTRSVEYVKAVERHEHVAPGDRTLVIPVIDAVKVGTRIILRAVPVEPDRLGVSFRLEVTSVEGWDVSGNADAGESAVPRMRRLTAESHAVVPESGAIVFPGPIDGDRQIVVALSFAPLDADASKDLTPTITTKGAKDGH